MFSSLKKKSPGTCYVLQIYMHAEIGIFQCRTLYMQFILSKEFHCMDVLSTLYLYSSCSKVHSETTFLNSVPILKELCSGAFMSYIYP